MKKNRCTTTAKSMEVIVYCKQCGAQMSDELTNCLLCGAPLVADEQSNETDLHRDDVAQNETVQAHSDELDGEAPEFADDQVEGVDENELGETSHASYEDVFAPFMENKDYGMVGSIDEESVDAETDNMFVPQSHSHVMSEREPKPRRGSGRAPSKRFAIIGGAAACVLTAAVAGALLLSTPNKQEYVQAQTKQAEETIEQKEVKQIKVTVSVKVPDLDDNGSRVPLRISGTLSDGSSYKNDVFANAEYVTVELAAGEYEATALASPINAEGVMYKTPEKGIKVSVKEDGTVTFNPQNSALEYTALDALKQSDELIKTAKEWITKDKERSSKAEELAKLARQRRVEAEYAQEQKSSSSYTSSSDEDYNDDESQTYTDQTNTTEDTSETSNTTSTEEQSTSNETESSSSTNESSSSTDSGSSSSTDSGSGSSGTSNSGSSSDSGSSSSTDSGTSSSTDSGTTDNGTSDSGSTDSGSSAEAEVTTEVQQ